MIRPSRQIWLCLHFPALALEVFADHASGALAIIEQQRVLIANTLAMTHGIETAMALNTAHALCPDLAVLERQPQREQELLQQLAHAVYRLSPDLALASHNSLLVEIGACRRLYGGITPLLELLQRGLDIRGHRVVLGLAHTRKAAWLLAQQQLSAALNRQQQLDNELLRQQLGSLPVAQLEIDRGIVAALAKMGIYTLAQLTALPLAALGKRFGAGFIRYLQQMLGTHPDPQSSFVPLPTFYARLNFIDGIHNRQGLLFPMKRLLQTLCDYLQARQLLCGTLQWELYDAHTPQAAMTIELMQAQPSADNNRLRTLLELSELKLQNLTLHDAVYTLILRSENFLPAHSGSLQLFADPDEAGGSLSTLIDKLRARLGASALQRLSYQPLHWPEACSLLTSLEQPPPAAAPASPTATSVLRPTWLLPTPQALREQDKKLFWHTPLQLLRGPERITNHWWEQNQNARDYYIARAEDGRLCWIFRDLSDGRWFGHGLFA